MFAIFYALFGLFGKIGWDIEYGIDKAQSRNKAIHEGQDVYWDKKGKQRLVSNNQQVITYRNMNDDVMRLDLKGNIVNVVSKHEESHYIIETVKRKKDRYGNPGELIDITTGKPVLIRTIHIEDKWEKRGRKYDNYGKTHIFYMDPDTLELIRESDGEVELRQKGYKKSPSKDEIDNFIIKFNKKQRESFKPIDWGAGERKSDWSPKAIDEMIWNQNH